MRCDHVSELPPSCLLYCSISTSVRRSLRRNASFFSLTSTKPRIFPLKMQTVPQIPISKYGAALVSPPGFPASVIALMIIPIERQECNDQERKDSVSDVVRDIGDTRHATDPARPGSQRTGQSTACSLLQVFDLVLV